MIVDEECVPLSALLSSRLLSALVALAMAIIALADDCGRARIAASAELSKRGAKRALKLSFNAAGEASGSTGCTSRYRIDSVMKNESDPALRKTSIELTHFGTFVKLPPLSPL
jgi:hypothetical protein